MASFKDRFAKWKEKKWYHKAGDVVFYLFLLAVLIPGPRKFIATNVNKVILHIRKPSLGNEEKAYQLRGEEYNWQITDLQGKTVNPKTLMGEVVFLNFWGTYCPPCIAEMPEIQELYHAYGDKVKFILLSAETPSKVKNFLASRDYDLPAYIGGRNMPQALAARSIPTTFIIARDGKIVNKTVGAADWNSRATHKIFDELLVRQQ